MNIYTPYVQAGNQYVPDSQRSERSNHVAYSAVSGYAPTWSRYEPRMLMNRDATTLARMLQPVELNEDAPLAEQIFGNQARQQRFSLVHAVNLLGERAQLHKRHVEDIDHRHLQVQEELFGARLHAREDGYRRATKLEQMLIPLEKERRQEDLAFWKDTADLRDRLFELGGDYQTVRHRAALLSGLEPAEDIHG